MVILNFVHLIEVIHDQNNIRKNLGCACLARAGWKLDTLIDSNLVHEVTSPQAFDGLRMAGRKVRVPQRPATLIASSPSSGVISTVVCIFEMAPPHLLMQQ